MGNTGGRIAGEQFLYRKDDLEESENPGEDRNAKETE
jgi:hypothetical protein